MNRFLLFILILLSLNFNSQTDKLLHVVAGAAIAIGAGQFTYRVSDRFWLSLGIAIPAAILGGVSKEEIYDRNLGLGTPSKDDKISTMTGGVYGTFFLTFILDRQEQQKAIIEQDFIPIFLPDTLR